MMAFVARLTVKPERRDEFESAQIELRRLTYAHEPDVPVYELLQSRTEPDTYLVVATFKSQAAFDQHMQADFHDRLVPPILATLSQDMELNFYDLKE